LHDIGKVAIPDCVLLKPGRLSDEEFEIMKQHTSLGAQTLQDALEEHPEAMFLQIARDIAISHHERFDGSGYPNGLTGDDIPLAGRIVAVADVFDALTSKRVYKEAFADHVSRSIVVDGAGAHFDPRIVDVFCGLKDEFDAINQHLRDGTAIAA
jgi:putative two-component system response regulator